MIIENNLRNDISNNLIIQFYFKLNFFESIFFYKNLYKCFKCFEENLCYVLYTDINK